jgi:aminocarboxymuconate-semialdehyde decarboxylase
VTSGPSPLRIDVHSHLMPDTAFARAPDGLSARRSDDPDEVALEVAARDGAVGRGAPRRLRDLAVHRAEQEARGVDVSLLGPWIDMIKAPADAETQARWCAVVNDELARATGPTAHSRFLAALCDFDGGLAADELERAVELGAVGGMLSANPDAGSLGRSGLDPLWRAAERLGVPIVLHPGEFEPPPRLRELFMVNLVGNPFETTLAVGSLIGADVPSRFPGLRLVLVHGGGFLPYQYGRMSAGFERWPGLHDKGLTPPRDLLRWFLYDTVLFDDEPTRYLLDLVGDDRVLAGSDCPFAMSDHRPFELPASLGLDAAGTARVLGENAARTFKIASFRPASGIG